MKNKNKYLKNTDKLSLGLHFLAILLMFFLSVGALRQNNLRMLELREEVFKADLEGLGVDEALNNLRIFVASHMNTALPKLGSEKAIQLKYSYERAVTTEQKRFQDELAVLSQKAKNNCGSIKNILDKVNCEEKFIKENPVKPTIEFYPETFSIDYISPRWSFDLAGWLILFTTFLTIILLGRIIALYLSVKYLKRHYK